MTTTITASTPTTSVDLFLESIKSPATRVTYKQSLKQFTEDTGFNLTSNKTKGKVLQEKIIEYVIELKKGRASYSRINVIISALQAYCDAYDVEVNFDKVRRYIPEQFERLIISLRTAQTIDGALIKSASSGSEFTDSLDALQLSCFGYRAVNPPDYYGDSQITEEQGGRFFV